MRGRAMSLEMFRQYKLSTERLLARGFRRRKQTDEERAMSPTSDGFIEVPLTADERAVLERGLDSFNRAIQMLEKNNST